MKSTMGAALSAIEEKKILDAWDALRIHSHACPASPDPIEMLDYCTDQILRLYEVRRAISDGWYYANKRLTPTPRPQPKPVPINKALSDALSMLSEDDLVEALRAIGGKNG